MTANITYSGKTEKGKREKNEDAYEAITFECNNERIHLLAVADGLGGHASGEIASRIAIMELRETIKRIIETMNVITNESLRDLLVKGFRKANDEIRYNAKISPDRRNMGTTMVAALVKDDGECVIANLGDSRAYLIGNGVWHTKDHNYVQSLVNAGEISEEEAFSHPMKNIVEKALGLEENAVPDLYEKNVKDEILLLSSDGLHDYVRDEEIKDIVLRHETQSCSELIKKALENKSEDNITVVVAKQIKT